MYAINNFDIKQRTLLLENVCYKCNKCIWLYFCGTKTYAKQFGLNEHEFNYF